MSKRFLRWVETWIEENIPPGANPDIESHEARAERLTEKLFADAAAAGFSNFETEEERERVSPRVLVAVAGGAGGGGGAGRRGARRARGGGGGGGAPPAGARAAARRGGRRAARARRGD